MEKRQLVERHPIRQRQPEISSLLTHEFLKSSQEDQNPPVLTALSECTGDSVQNLQRKLLAKIGDHEGAENQEWSHGPKYNMSTNNASTMLKLANKCNSDQRVRLLKE